MQVENFVSNIFNDIKILSEFLGFFGLREICAANVVSLVFEFEMGAHNNILLKTI